MNSAKAEQAIVNGIYAAVAWLILDLGLMFKAHGREVFSVLVSQPEMIAGIIIAVICIAGLLYKSRLAAVVLFLLFLVPLVTRLVQGIYPSSMLTIFSLILLYLFLAAVLGAFSYHQLKTADQDKGG